MTLAQRLKRVFNIDGDIFQECTAAGRPVQLIPNRLFDARAPYRPAGYTIAGWTGWGIDGEIALILGR